MKWREKTTQESAVSYRTRTRVLQIGDSGVWISISREQQFSEPVAGAPARLEATGISISLSGSLLSGDAGFACALRDGLDRAIEIALEMEKEPYHDPSGKE